MVFAIFASKWFAIHSAPLQRRRGAEWMVNRWLAKVSVRSFHIYGITAKHLEKEFQSVLNIYGKKSAHFENVFQSGLIWSQI